MEFQQRIFISFLFQPHGGLANSGPILTTEKPGKMDVAEALDLSEKLVCTDSLCPRPVQSWVPC